MNKQRSRFIDRVAHLVTALFVIDRLLKLAAVHHFFRRAGPPPPTIWPSVSLVQPITRGSSGLRRALTARLELVYPGTIQHVLICDAHDVEVQTACQELIAGHPACDATVVTAQPTVGVIASKIEKMQAGLAVATGAVLCFMDDDVTPRPGTMEHVIPYLAQPGVGAAFGLANYTDWETIWSSLMSGFVNAHALISYIPVTYLARPFTITGHFFLLWRSTFVRVGGFEGLEQRVDDDHELARRLRRVGLDCVQTSLIYDIDNDLRSLTAYANQLRRWFVFPRQMLWPFLTPRERAVTAVGSVGTLGPGLLGILALLTGRRSATLGLLGSLGLWGVVYHVCETAYLKRRTPLRRWPLLLYVAVATPWQVLASLVGGNTVTWRGQRMDVARGGRVKVLP